MTTKKIVEALCFKSFSDCVQAIVPPWAEGVNDDVAREAWKNVRTLRVQRDELAKIWPHKKSELDQQFNAAVLKEARAVHEAFFEFVA